MRTNVAMQKNDDPAAAGRTHKLFSSLAPFAPAPPRAWFFLIAVVMGGHFVTAHGQSGGASGTVVAHWRMDEGGGTTIFDAVGSHHGTMRHGSWWNSSGVLNGCVELDGIQRTSPHLVVADSPLIGEETLGDALAISFYFYLNQMPPSGSSYFLIHKELNYNLEVQGDGCLLAHIWNRFDVPADTSRIFSNTRVVAGRWYHVIFAFDGAADTGQLWLDNTLDAERTDFTGTMESSSNQLVLGERSAFSPTRPVHGRIDEVVISTGILQNEFYAFDDFAEPWPSSLHGPPTTVWQELDSSSNGLWNKIWWRWDNPHDSPPWYCDFLPQHVGTSADAGDPTTSDLILKVPGGLSEGGHVTTAAKTYGYGAYRARMKTAAISGADGVVAAFFYSLNQHGEIDVEILSADQGTSYKLRFAIHDLRTPNRASIEKEVDLGFDPAARYAEYGFDWYPDHVDCVVNGVLRETIDATEFFIPSLPGAVSLNHWTGNQNFGGGPPPADACLRVDAVTATSLRLSANAANLSAATGGAVGLFLDGAPRSAGRVYRILASSSGDRPGIHLGQVTVPLNWDALTVASLQLANGPWFQNTYGTLDAHGRACALFDTGGPLPPAWMGLTLNFAALLLSPEDVASTAVAITVVP